MSPIPPRNLAARTGPTPNNSSRVKLLARTWQMLVGISELVSYGFY